MKRVVMLSLLLAVVPLAMAQTQDQARTRAQDQTRAQVQDQARAKAQDQTRSRIYGSQLMTPAERVAYRQKIRAAKTQAERNRIRAEHHKAMQERARQRGMTLPDMPMQPMHRGGMQPRQGGGQGGGRSG